MTETEKTWLPFEIINEYEVDETDQRTTTSQVIKLEGVRVDDLPADEFKNFILTLANR